LHNEKNVRYATIINERADIPEIASERQSVRPVTLLTETVKSLTVVFVSRVPRRAA
jgi:hypothetical protein